MATEQQVRESLEEILTPGAMRSPVKLNLVRENKVRIFTETRYD
jgi:hypothetical protein